MRVLVMVPAFNEQASVLDVIQDIREHCPEMDYVVIDDCSTDETRHLLVSHSIPYLGLSCNLGIGGCIQTGYQYALERKYDIAVQFDGDGQHDAKYLHDLIRPITENRADVVIGSRFILKQGFQSGPVRRIGIGFLSRMLHLLSGIHVEDVTSGMRAVGVQYIAEYARKYAQDYPEPEALLTAAVRGARIVEVPVEMRKRQNGESSIGPLWSVYYIVKVTLALILERLSA